MTHKIYVYGTLMPKDKPAEGEAYGTMYDVGHFPAVLLGGETRTFAYTSIEVDDVTQHDAYEGYNPDNLSSSLYLRKPFKDGWIYVWNRSVANLPIVADGDWRAHRERKNAANRVMSEGGV